MKDYIKVAERIRTMGNFCDIHNCGCPTKNHPVNLYFQICEAYIIGYGFYVPYECNEWSIDYTLDNAVKIRSDMQTIRGIKTDKDMYNKVEEVINKIRRKCGVK